jgi:hypothetical protein
VSKQKLRPSQIITTFGPGAIVDLPDDSVMLAGIEHWFDGFKPHRKISEPRLQAALRVSEFRTPPVGSYNDRDIPFVRFPRWRVCPGCQMLSDRFRFPQRGDIPLPPVPRCDRCNRATYPARLVIACPKGHIDDFPWYRWVHRGQNCGGGSLYLRGEGKSAAIGDLNVTCSCGKSRTLSGALSRDAMAELGVRCSRKRPWLNDDEDPDDCSAGRARLYALQRGASNVYFSVVRSALSVPPWADPLQAEVASWWGAFKTPLPPEVWSTVIQARFPDKAEAKIRECISRLEGLKTEHPSIRREEYDVFNADQDHHSEYFESRRQEMSASTRKFISRLVAVSRLREVRALLGFTRIEPTEMDPTMEVFNEEQGIAVTPAPLAAMPLDWLPAVENLGEGVFMELDQNRLRRWEAMPDVAKRTGALLQAYSSWRQRRGLPELKQRQPRLILLHTLAHLLIRQMSLECGYSSASLRERIYSDAHMAGVLIYTSSPDSDGSLGGLVRQARLTQNPDGSARDNFARLLLDVLDAARICSSDPLCREHEPRMTDRLSGAACHACAMVSETSCEFGNRLLDRGTIVTLPKGRSKGYFDFDD